jgi:hypothetical protein
VRVVCFCLLSLSACVGRAAPLEIPDAVDAGSLDASPLEIPDAADAGSLDALPADGGDAGNDPCAAPLSHLVLDDQASELSPPSTQALSSNGELWISWQAQQEVRIARIDPNAGVVLQTFGRRCEPLCQHQLLATRDGVLLIWGSGAQTRVSYAPVDDLLQELPVFEYDYHARFSAVVHQDQPLVAAMGSDPDGARAKIHDLQGNFREIPLLDVSYDSSALDSFRFISTGTRQYMIWHEQPRSRVLDVTTEQSIEEWSLEYGSEVMIPTLVAGVGPDEQVFVLTGDLGDRRITVHFFLLDAGGVSRRSTVQKYGGGMNDFGFATAFDGENYAVVWNDFRDVFDNSDYYSPRRLYFARVSPSGEVVGGGASDIPLTPNDRRDVSYPALAAIEPGVYAAAYFRRGYGTIEASIGRFICPEPIADHPSQE